MSPIKRADFIRKQTHLCLIAKIVRLVHVFLSIDEMVIQLFGYDFVGSRIRPFNVSIAVRLDRVAHDIRAPWILAASKAAD